MSEYEEGNPDYKGYPGEEVETWSEYLDNDLNWIRMQPENRNYNMATCKNNDIACGNKYYTCKKCRSD